MVTMLVFTFAFNTGNNDTHYYRITTQLIINYINDYTEYTRTFIYGIIGIIGIDIRYMSC